MQQQHKKRRREEEPDVPNWRSATFESGTRGVQRVFVHVNEDGAMSIAADGRITMRYKNKEGATTYPTYPSKVRLVDGVGSSSPPGACTVLPSPRRPPPPSPLPAASAQASSSSNSKELPEWKNILPKYQRSINVCFVAQSKNVVAATIRFRCGEDYSVAKTLEESAALVAAKDMATTATQLVGSILQRYERMGSLLDLDRVPKARKTTAPRRREDKKMSDGVLVLVLDNTALHQKMKELFLSVNNRLHGYTIVSCACKAIGTEKVVDVVNATLCTLK